jgi:predicted nuclease of predicted toxin-antitoxin system
VAGWNDPADEPGVRLFVDENLSPLLVSVGNDRGYDATCARDRNLLGTRDRIVLDFCIHEDRVCVTNNADDFRELVGDVELHPGLIVLPNVARESQFQLFDQALQLIEQDAEAAGQAPRDLMVNHVLEVDETGAFELYELPAAG